MHFSWISRQDVSQDIAVMSKCAHTKCTFAMKFQLLYLAWLKRPFIQPSWTTFSFFAKALGSFLSAFIFKVFLNCEGELK